MSININYDIKLKEYKEFNKYNGFVGNEAKECPIQVWKNLNIATKTCFE